MSRTAVVLSPRGTSAAARRRTGPSRPRQGGRGVRGAGGHPPPGDHHDSSTPAGARRSAGWPARCRCRRPRRCGAAGSGAAADADGAPRACGRRSAARVISTFAPGPPAVRRAARAGRRQRPQGAHRRVALPCSIAVQGGLADPRPRPVGQRDSGCRAEPPHVAADHLRPVTLVGRASSGPPVPSGRAPAGFASSMRTV